MARYAMFLNRNLTAGHESIFQLLYSIDLIICVYMSIISPIIMYVSYNAEPLHRNLRIALACIVSHGVTGFAPRIVLIYAQCFVEDFSEYDTLFTICTMLRRTMMCFLMYILLYFTLDRLIATFYWSWYEQEGFSTLISAVVMIAAPEAAGLWTAKILTYDISNADSSMFAKYFFMAFLAASFASGGVLFVFLLHFNRRALRNLQRRKHFSKYSLNRTYQLRENLVIMKLAADIAIPAVLWTTPCFIFMGLYRALPDEYMFAKQIFVALYDVWIGVTAATAVSVFPFADHRFRKVVARIPIVRLLLPNHYLHLAPDKKKSEHEIEKDKLDNTAVYFSMLSKDLAALK